MKLTVKITRWASPPIILVLGLLITIAIGTLLLKLPVSTQDGVTLQWVDAFFTATSAACVTGLVVVDVETTFTVFGETVIVVLMQIGGLGFMTMATLFALVLGRRLSLRDRLLLKEAINAESMEGIVRIVRKVMIFSFTIEGIAAVILALRWATEMSLGQAIYYGLFHSVSLFNNGGFDLFGNSFQFYTGDWLFNLVASVLVISGGLGFVVLNDLFEYRKTRASVTPFQARAFRIRCVDRDWSPSSVRVRIHQSSHLGLVELEREDLCFDLSVRVHTFIGYEYH